MTFEAASIALGLALSASSVPESREVETLLSGTPVTCHVRKSWGKTGEGESWLRFDMSCNLPAAVKALVGGVGPGELLDSLNDPDARYAAAAALAAAGRFRELSPAERARFVLELARRENEPLASASIAFVFGETPWWDLEDSRRRERTRPLGDLAAPWDGTMTPVIREYLFPDLEHRPVSTLAVYLCRQMGPALGAEIVPDLERVVRLQPDSLAGELARSTIEALQAAR